MASLILACGCTVRFVDGDVPACATHGPQRVVRAMTMPRPRFRGAVTGPVAETVDVSAFTGPLVSKADV